jgi:hypothetical protein
METQELGMQGQAGIVAQAIMDLTDANISPAAHTTAWETEVAFLRDDACAGEPTAYQEEIDRVIEVATALD